MLLAIKSQTDAARSLALYGALQFDIANSHPDAAVRAAAQGRGDLLIPIIKGWSTELSVPLASLGVQVHGGMGFIEETGAAQILRDARITSIYEGTTGIQAMDLVGRKILRDGGAAMNALIADMNAQLASIVEGAPDAIASRDAAMQGVQLLQSSTEHILRAAKQGHDVVQAVAVPYLMLCGYVIGGGLTARAHAIAASAHESDAAFHASKRQLARFYTQHILPQVKGLASVVAGGADSVVSADAALF